MPTTDEDRRTWDLIRRGGWDAHAESFSVRGELRHLVERGPAAISALRRELGEGFANTYRRDHAVASYLQNWAPHSRKSLVWLGEAMQRLRSRKNWKKFRKKLTAPSQPNDVREALATILVADKLVRVGYDVAFEVRVIENAKPLRPDLEALWPNGPLVNVEVSLLNVSLDAVQKGILVDALAEATRGLAACGAWLREPTVSERDAVLARVGAGADNVLRTRGFWATPDDDDLLALGLAWRREDPELVAWAGRRRVHINSLSGPAIRGDDHVRLFRRLGAEHLQLPIGASGFVAVVDHSVMPMLKPPSTAIEAQRLILAAAPNVVGSTVIHHYWARGTTTHGEHAWHHWTEEHDEMGNVEHRTLVMREDAATALGDAAAEALRYAFTSMPWC